MAVRVDNPIEYSKVGIAMQSLLGRRDVAIAVEEGWSIFTERSGTIWSFVPLNHPGYPALMRQRVRFAENGTVTVDMAVLCEATKTPCEKVVAEMRERNRHTAARIMHAAIQRLNAEQGSEPLAP